MPDIILLCSVDDARRVESFIGRIGPDLRAVTAQALNLKGSKEAAFMIVPFAASDNLARFQILCIASHSPEREAKIEKWRNLLAQAWENFAKASMEEWGEDFSGELEVWPTMPIGMWGLFLNGQLVRG